MPIELSAPGQAPKKEWKVTGRFVLVSLLLFFAVVASVNAVMMTVAIRTFSGTDAKNGYDLSQGYNRELAMAQQQQERGWQAEIQFIRASGDGGKLTLALKTREGQPVTGLVVQAQVTHPSDGRRDHRLMLNEVSAGVYEGREAGVTAGPWDLRIVATRDGERIYEARSRATLG